IKVSVPLMAPGVEPVHGAAGELDPPFRELIFAVPAGCRAPCAGVDDDQPFMSTLQNSARPEDHRLRHRGIAHAKEYALRMTGNVRRRRAWLPASFGRKLLGFSF